MCGTNNLVKWDNIPTPHDTLFCNSLASHAQSHCLYGLWTTTTPADHNHLVVHDFNGKIRERKPNARTPHKQWQPADFCLGNSLILAGGHDGRKA